MSDNATTGLYLSRWTYYPYHSHTNTDTTTQTFDLAGFLDDSGGDCRDFGNMYTCMLRSLGAAGQADIVYGQFGTKPILGSNLGSWASYNFNFHQFGWYSSQVHDAEAMVNQSSPIYSINMDRDTTYKGYFYDTGYWTPSASFVCSVGTWALSLGESWPADLTPGLDESVAKKLDLDLVSDRSCPTGPGFGSSSPP